MLTTIKHTRKHNKKTIHLTKKRTNYSGRCILVPLTKINTKQLVQLAMITKDKEIMKYIGRGNTWSIADIKQFIKDETLESKKQPTKRQYYTFIMVCNNDVVGFIAGRKNKNLLPKDASPYDLLLRMFISRKHSGKGFGKLIIKLFISYYSRILRTSKSSKSIKSIKSSSIKQNGSIKLISDIDKDNIASIKIHTSNGFIHTDTITYPNKHTYQRYEFII